MRARSVLVLGVGMFLGGCAYNVQYTPTGSSGNGIRMLFEYPAGEYEILGIYDYDFYRPGFRQPTLSDVWPDLSQDVQNVGGNACIVRDQAVGQANNRFIKVTCEVLRLGA